MIKELTAGDKTTIRLAAQELEKALTEKDFESMMYRLDSAEELTKIVKNSLWWRTKR